MGHNWNKLCSIKLLIFLLKAIVIDMKCEFSERIRQSWVHDLYVKDRGFETLLNTSTVENFPTAIFPR